MKLPRDLSGQDLADALCRHWGDVKIHQAGSHIIIQTQEPSPHRMAVPAHKAVSIGTLSGILRDVAKHKGASRQAILNSL